MNVTTEQHKLPQQERLISTKLSKNCVRESRCKLRKASTRDGKPGISCDVTKPYAVSSSHSKKKKTMRAVRNAAEIKQDTKRDSLRQRLQLRDDHCRECPQCRLAALWGSSAPLASQLTLLASPQNMPGRGFLLVFLSVLNRNTHRSRGLLAATRVRNRPNGLRQLRQGAEKSSPSQPPARCRQTVQQACGQISALTSWSHVARPRGFSRRTRKTVTGGGKAAIAPTDRLGNSRVNSPGLPARWVSPAAAAQSPLLFATSRRVFSRPSTKIGIAPNFRPRRGHSQMPLESFVSKTHAIFPPWRGGKAKEKKGKEPWDQQRRLNGGSVESSLHRAQR